MLTKIIGKFMDAEKTTVASYSYTHCPLYQSKYGWLMIILRKVAKLTV